MTDTKQGKSSSAVKSGMFAGAVAGSGVRVVVSPLDVLKIRMQLAVNGEGGRSPNTWTTIRRIYQTEGPLAFWNGHVPAQLLSIGYCSVQFGTYEYLNNTVPHFESRYFPRAFLIGGCAGLTATGIAYPLDTVRTRFVMQSRNERVYTSVWHASRSMLATEGFTSFFRGIVPTLLQSFPYAGLKFGYYNMFKRGWSHLVAPEKGGASEKIGFTISGAVAGLLSKLNVLPFDVVKKRLQVQGFAVSSYPVYNGLWDCITTMYRTEGLRAFFKGATASTAKAMLSTSLTFVLYEYVLSKT